MTESYDEIFNNSSRTSFSFVCLASDASKEEKVKYVQASVTELPLNTYQTNYFKKHIDRQTLITSQMADREEKTNNSSSTSS